MLFAVQKREHLRDIRENLYNYKIHQTYLIPITSSFQHSFFVLGGPVLGYPKPQETPLQTTNTRLGYATRY